MIRESLQNALKEAMKAHDSTTVNAVRLIIAGQKEKDVEARGKGLSEASDSDLMLMMQTMIKQRNESVDIYEKAGRHELAEKEKSEIAVIEKFLPKQLNEQEITEIVKDIIKETGAESIKDMGKIMAVLKAKYTGQLDFGKASGVIKALLG